MKGVTRAVYALALAGLLGAYGWVPHSHTLRSGARRSRAGQAAGVNAQRVPGTPAVSSNIRVGQRLSLALNADNTAVGSTVESLVAKPGGSYDVDVAVIGGGPAGLTMAALLAQKHGLKVALMDPKLDKRWLPNYGVWFDEWRELENILGFSVEHCLMKVWRQSDLFFGGSNGIPADELRRVDRAYARVDRAKLKAELLSRAVAGGAVMVKAAVDHTTLKHDSQGSLFRCDDGSSVRTKLILDCSGFGSKLVELDGDAVPGVQIAYGIEAEVDVCPYDEESMTLMDYRTNYLKNPDDLDIANREPTFNYAMPMGDGENGSKRVFFEETSLVARPPMTFEECKRRLALRLEHLGCKVLKVEEEEFCYIPMGGSLPKANQRVVGFGGVMALAHPATGYTICRTLAAAGPCAAAMAQQLKRGAAFQPDVAAKAVYDATWNRQTRQQRDFMVFGGEFLMLQGAGNLRGFFDSFFRLPDGLWTGFLAGWPGLPNNVYHETWEGRLTYGLRFFLLAPLPLKFALAKAAVLMGGIPFFRSVTPLAAFQKEPSDEPLVIAARNVSK